MTSRKALDCQTRLLTVSSAGGMFILLVLALLLPGFLPAKTAPENIITKQITVIEGSSVNIRDTIRGYRSTSYRFSAKAGQRLTVTLKTTNGANYLNIYAPGYGPGDEAIHAGDISGNSFDSMLNENGVYTVNVFLMRSAARRNETARYTLSIKLDPGKASATRNGTAIRWPANYDAAGQLRCMNISEQSSTWCEFRVQRRPGAATIWVVRPDKPHALRIIYFANKAFSTDDTWKVNWKQEGDNWRVSVGKDELYIIPDAAIFGG